MSGICVPCYCCNKHRLREPVPVDRTLGRTPNPEKEVYTLCQKYPKRCIRCAKITVEMISRKHQAPPDISCVMISVFPYPDFSLKGVYTQDVAGNPRRETEPLRTESGRREKRMLNSFVGIYNLATDKADVFAHFWSSAHAFDYAVMIQKNIIRDDARVLFLHDMDGNIRFLCDSTETESGKRWERYEKATARDLCGVHPLSAWSDHGVKAGKAVVLGAIREAVEAVA